MIRQCITCQNDKIEEVVKDNKRYFYCQTCKKLYERILDSRYGKDIAVNTDEGIKHFSAGGLIYQGDRFLMVKRRNWPFGFGFPSGHIEYNEKPLNALKREILEETGLDVKKATLIFNGEIKNEQCRYGANIHIWYFYSCEVSKGTPFLNSESEDSGWFTKQEAEQLPLVPAAQYLMTQAVL